MLDAAERAIRRVGADVSMSEIAAEAGLTKPALYAAFPNKASLADALAERIALDLGRQIAQLVREDRPVREVTHTMVERFCALADGDPQLYRFLVHGSMGLDRHFEDRRLVNAAAAVTTFGLRLSMERAHRDPAPAETWAYAIIGGILYALDWWIDTRSVSLESLIDHLTDAAWALLVSAGAEQLEGPLVPPDQPSIFEDLIVRKPGEQPK